MVETTQAAGGEYNPFDTANMLTGGGLWDGKTVTITEAVAKVETLKYKDGSVVVDEKTKQPAIQTALYIKGIADGEDTERHEEYSVGDKLTPTADGEGFVDKATGGPAKFHANSAMGKLAASIKASGFDIASLIDRNPDGSIKQRLKRLVGARFTFKAEPKVGRDGKPLKDKKGYDKNLHLPVKFVGYVTGAGAKPGNGAAAPAGGDAISEKAKGAVLAALAAAGGTLTRADLVRSLAQTLSGDDANRILGLVVQDSFHKGQAWKYDGVNATL